MPSTPKSRPGDITSKWFFDNVFDQAEEALRIISGDSPTDYIYTENEATNSLTRRGILTGGIKPDDTFSSLNLTSDGRLKVDTSISIQDIELDVGLEHANDSVALADRSNDNFLRIEADGSLNVNAALSGILDDDSILIVGTDDGTLSGNRQLAKINNENLYVKDEDLQAEVADLKDKVPSKLITEEFDDIEMSYVAGGNGVGQLEVVTYKNGGLTVGTINLTYDSDHRLIRAQRI